MESSPGMGPDDDDNTGKNVVHAPAPSTRHHPSSSSSSAVVATIATSSSSCSSSDAVVVPAGNAERPAARHVKRLTLNFPINLPPSQQSLLQGASDAVGTPLAEPTTPAAQSSARASPIMPPAAAAAAVAASPLPFNPTLDDGYDFLTAIASQERKVLELREELQRAETELAALKKQWALSERTRKTTEISYRAEPMLSMRSPEPARSSFEGSPAPRDARSKAQARLSRDLDRRSSLRISAAAAAAAGATTTGNIEPGVSFSANGRRVFQGSHTRTLSLLSPVTGTAPSSIDSHLDAERVARTPRSATLPSVERSGCPSEASIAKSADGSLSISGWPKSMPPPSREALMRTGKQMASDLKEGLWTFLEDIRQATVGDEGINATESRTVPSLSPAARKRDASATARSRDRLSVEGLSPRRSPAPRGSASRSPSASLSSLSSLQEKGLKGAKTPTKSGKDIVKSTDIAASFWSEFGVDTPGQTSSRNLDLPIASNGRKAAQKGSTTVAVTIPPPMPASTGSSLLDPEDNWDMWDTPQPRKLHSPSSSRSSTFESNFKHDQSPITQTSSPRTSARYACFVSCSVFFFYLFTADFL